MCIREYVREYKREYTRECIRECIGECKGIYKGMCEISDNLCVFELNLCGFMCFCENYLRIHALLCGKFL